MPWSIDPNSHEEFQHDIEDFQLIGDPLFTVGVPRDMPQECKSNIFGAAKSYYMGNNSIDYTIKKYSEYWKLDFTEKEEEKYLSLLCSLVREHATGVIKYFMSIPNKPDKPNIFACSAAIQRLANSFQGATLCASQCLHFEAVTISRIILEQLSWMYSISQLTGDLYEFTKVSPHKSISRLKEIIPNAGRGYGFLSEKSHILFQETLNYLDINEKTKKIRLYDYHLSAHDALNLLILVDWLGIIGEYIYFNLLQEHRFVQLTIDGEVKAKPDREFIEVIEKGEKIIDKLQEYKEKNV